MTIAEAEGPVSGVSFCAEIGSNHNGSLIRACQLIDAAAEAGFDSVKFQQWTVETLFRPEALAARPALWARRKLELPLEWHEQLEERAEDNGLLYGVTPFYAGCLPYLDEFVDFFKISSYQITDHKIIAAISRYEKPVVVSTGMATLEEVRSAVDVAKGAGQKAIALMHCVSCYPAPTSQANLSAIGTLRKELGLQVGWSDHTLSPTVVRAAIWRWGAGQIELHWDLGDSKGVESEHSWSPSSLRHVIGWLHDIPSSNLSQFDGTGEKAPAQCELEERSWRSDPSDGLRPMIGIMQPRKADNTKHGNKS